MRKNKKDTCNCVEAVEAEMTALMVRNTGKEAAESVRLSPQFLYSQTYPLYFEARGKVHHGGRKLKFDVNITLSFCPFCGRKLLTD